MEEINLAMPHGVYLEKRNKLKITGVTDIGLFDEESITASTTEGNIVIMGEGLHITRIDLDSGELLAEGNFTGFTYTERQNKNESFLSKLFR